MYASPSERSSTRRVVQRCALWRCVCAWRCVRSGVCCVAVCVRGYMCAAVCAWRCVCVAMCAWLCVCAALCKRGCVCVAVCVWRCHYRPPSLAAVSLGCVSQHRMYSRASVLVCSIDAGDDALWDRFPIVNTLWSANVSVRAGAAGGEEQGYVHMCVSA